VLLFIRHKPINDGHPRNRFCSQPVALGFEHTWKLLLVFVPTFLITFVVVGLWFKQKSER
jgi:hypothetical protein